MSLLFCLSLFIKGFAQDEMPTIGVGVTTHFGAILPHRPLINEIIGGHTQAYEFSFYKPTYGKKEWQKLYSYPKVGVSVLFMGLGNPQKLGKAYGIFPYIDLPLNKKKVVSWRLKIGYGIAYIENPFNRETNFKNVAIGSHINALLYINTGWSLKLSNSISTNLGLSLIHFSNGSFSRPNLGLNIFSLNTGVSYQFGEKKALIKADLEERPHQWRKKIMLGFGIKEIPPAEGPKYVVSSYSFNLIKTRATKSSYGFGVDAFYNSSLTVLLNKDSSTTSTSNLDNLRLGLVGIYSFDFGKISLLVEMGGYVYSKYKGNGFIYHRISSRYNVTEKIFLNMGLKTHFAVADFVEFGIGYNLK
ncbi:MAG: acyloxyacyl hydrolase [Flavobacteriales bacterium]|nr:acyloxyacyl hydrolase [Flavobacteriales bacterium]